MKVGIYGDSFANFKGSHGNTLQWEDHLNNIMPSITTVNYGQAGTGLYYSYEKFLNTKHLYDKKIFIANLNIRAFFRGFEHINGANAVDIVLRNNSTEYTAEQIQHLNAIRSYYLYLIDIDERLAMHKLMYNEILKEENTLIIRAFDNNTIDLTDTNISLFSIAEIDHRAAGIDIMDFGKYDDLRGNHLNQRNCKIVASKISNWLQTGEFDMRTINEFGEDSTHENFNIRK